MNDCKFITKLITTKVFTSELEFFLLFHYKSSSASCECVHSIQEVNKFIHSPCVVSVCLFVLDCVWSAHCCAFVGFSCRCAGEETDLDSSSQVLPETWSSARQLQHARGRDLCLPDPP